MRSNTKYVLPSIGKLTMCLSNMIGMRHVCAMKRIKDGKGLLVPQLVTVGHIPSEVSKLCLHFTCHGGDINGVVEDYGCQVETNSHRPRRHRELKIKQPIREAYFWECTGEVRNTERLRVEPDPLEEDSEEIDL